MKVVIVGGVAGGASAAARIRRLDEHAQIIMIERSGYVSYANCGLPYYVGGVIKEQEELTLQTPESFWDRFRIDVRVRQEVTAINPAEKTVTVHVLDSGKVYTETYDKLLLAPGAKPTVPALSGVSSERVFTLRTVEDTLRIRRFVEDQKPKTAVLAGGGFIGLEMAENLAEMGVSVTIVQRPKQLLAPLDADMASFVHAEMRRHGVALRLGETVTGFQQNVGMFLRRNDQPVRLSRQRADAARGFLRLVDAGLDHGDLNVQRRDQLAGGVETLAQFGVKGVFGRLHHHRDAPDLAVGEIQPPVQPQLARGAQDALFLGGIDAAAMVDDPVHRRRRHARGPRHIRQRRLAAHACPLVIPGDHA